MIYAGLVKSVSESTTEKFKRVIVEVMDLGIVRTFLVPMDIPIQVESVIRVECNSSLDDDFKLYIS